MKQGWEIKRLEELAIKLFAGGDKPKVFSEHPTDTLNIPVYANGVSLNGLVGYTDKAIVDKESITISARGTIGFCCIRQTPFVPIVRLITIIPTEEIRTRYLYYALSNATIENNGVAIPQLTIPMIKGIPIPIPPREEQGRIVEILDREFERIDAIKANAEQNLQHAKNLFQAALKQELQPKEGWGISILSDVVRVINGRAYRKEELLTSGKYRVLRVGNFFTNDSWYYSNLELEEDKYCEGGDLLYAWSASFGPKIWNGEKVVYHYHIWKIVPDYTIDKLFLFYWLQSPHLTNQVMSNLHGTTMAHITKGIMEATSISCPSIQEQAQIVARLDKLNERCKALEENYKKTIALCDDMKKALLRKAFNGEL